LSLTHVAFLLLAFHNFFGGGGVAATLRLPSRVFSDSTLGPFDEAPIDSALRVQADMRRTGIDVSPSKPGMGAIKLSRSCEQVYEE
jgi:hypothetical protein